MNERAIQNALFADLNQKGRQIMVPNYTPAGWWECDLFSVTAAGYMIEHEIKLTRSDFRADAKKERREFPNGYLAGPVQESKYQRLALADPKGPSRFFYVVPADLVKPEEVPEWAGLIYVTPRDHYHLFATAKPAPTLHRVKADPKVTDHARGVLYWRFWNLRRGLKEEVIA